VSSRQRVKRVIVPVIRRIGARRPAIRNFLIRELMEGVDLDFPSLEARHLDNAQLFANRKDLISSMRSIEGGVIAEVGVAHGGFSEFLMDQLKPKRFVAFDLFNMHEWGEAWGVPTAQLLNNMTHLEFYKKRFADRSTEVVIEVGMSHLTLAKYPDKSFDLIYIDADHSYEGVKKDAEVAKNKVADNGVLIFNDYQVFSLWDGYL
jgi:Methyltransferase domain